jgi:signal transduction histidine kinase
VGEELRDSGVHETAPEHEARSAGVHASDVGLSDVDRRRTQLWTTSLFVVAAITVVIALLTLGGDFIPEQLRLEDLPSWIVIALVAGLLLAFLLYVMEKESHLRKLSRMLVEEREKSTRLEQMDHLKSDFVATVSHELKTPLTAIIGAAKTVGRREAQMSPEQHARFMDMIQRQGTRLLRLVEDVLDTTRIEAGTQHLKREPLDLKMLASEIMEDVVGAYPGREQDLVLISDPGGPTAWGDPTALQQIVGNLVDNALKYSRPGSKVTVTVTESATEAIIEVGDEGRGISPDQIRTIFERFRQAEFTGPVTAGGFGLGLYIVKNLVATQKGSVEVASELGKGSTFRVLLPKRAEENPAEG